MACEYGTPHYEIRILRTDGGVEKTWQFGDRKSAEEYVDARWQSDLSGPSYDLIFFDGYESRCIHSYRAA